MTRYIPDALKDTVRERAENRCEYCRLSQEGQEATFHIDHIKPVAARGEATLGNLALACVSCSLRKAARQTAIDPDTREEVTLFDPRNNVWDEHFVWDNVSLVGLTAIGRATIDVLNLNRSVICAIRAEEAMRGRHP